MQRYTKREPPDFAKNKKKKQQQKQQRNKVDPWQPDGGKATMLILLSAKKDPYPLA